MYVLGWLERKLWYVQVQAHMCHMSQCEGQRTTSRSQLCPSTVEGGSGDQIQVVRLKPVSLLSHLSPKVKCSNLTHPCYWTYEKLKHGNKTAKKQDRDRVSQASRTPFLCQPFAERIPIFPQVPQKLPITCSGLACGPR